MTSPAANRLLPKVALVCLCMVCAFFVATWYMSRPPQAMPVAAPVFETKKQQTSRLGREQSAKDWGAAQKRADDRNAADRAQ